MQDVIANDLKRIQYMIENYTKSEDKDDLIRRLNDTIKSIPLNRFKEDPDMELNIKLTDDYLIFSYYSMDDDNKPLFDTPSIVIMSRTIHKIYFIDEVYSVFREEESDDKYNRGYDEIRYFELRNNIIKQYKTTLEEYTVDLFDKSFFSTALFLKVIERCSTPCNNFNKDSSKDVISITNETDTSGPKLIKVEKPSNK